MDKQSDKYNKRLRLALMKQKSYIIQYTLKETDNATWSYTAPTKEKAKERLKSIILISATGWKLYRYSFFKTNLRRLLLTELMWKLTLK